ncbi:hypothetical protein B0T21DRAFT_161028 [Apiosordaria backusii]|uniref:Tetraspanin n=1 Tax=Apiosordaria backusii TaxID=314023 RepID=A0AA40EI83_9PEZI|nr:hypothetical protein B0T21DRAFT_161028 [Apiosordaria backusii]
MALLLVLYALLIISLTGLTIYEHLTTTTLSLPLSPTLTILTILLPLFSLLTTSVTSFSLSPHRNRTSKPLFPLLSNLFQFILTIILTTLYGSTLTTRYTPCALETKWKDFWTSHDSNRIRTIQDALNCCGFRTTKDMAWPFPSGKNGGDVMTCERQFGRHTPCAGVWEDQLNKTAAVELGVVVLVGVVQILSLVLFRGGKQQRRRGKAKDNNRSEWLGRVVEIITGGGSGEEDEGARRPLLTGGAGRGSERYLTATTANGHSVGQDENHDSSEDEGEHANGDTADRAGYEGAARTAQQPQTRTDNDNGGGPRVEVSHHDPWAGAERV